MAETYCIVGKRKTPCVDPSGYKRDKRGRLQFFCKCAVCRNKKVRNVKNSGQVGTGKGRKTKRNSKT